MDTPAATAAANSSQAWLGGADQQPSDMSVDGASTRLAFGSTSGSAAGATGQNSAGPGVDEPGGMGQGWPGGRGIEIGEVAIRTVETVAGNVENEGAHAAGG